MHIKLYNSNRVAIKYKNCVLAGKIVYFLFLFSFDRRKLYFSLRKPVLNKIKNMIVVVFVLLKEYKPDTNSCLGRIRRKKARKSNFKALLDE
jgi:hypothetical protein